ncbi:hypothetical protein NEICINOT_03027 [Neisseria cinerea ATCC 14685]|uniref:Uncharacterized protein n=1 Tax=Neisseria cinerea ATCC 14685 TaxID=546262 RepID=D0W062_NEICI|nr:hypothetical protein NEICINOT_03027 [Neisseria cinerea ATCC 14685]
MKTVVLRMPSETGYVSDGIFMEAGLSGRIFGICPMPAVEYPFYPQQSRCLHAKSSTSTWTHSTHR